MTMTSSHPSRVRRTDALRSGAWQLPQTFTVVPLYLSSMNETDRTKMLDFQKRASRLQKAIMGAARANEEALVRVQHIRGALDQIDGPDPKLVARVNAVDTTLRDIDEILNGDPTLRAANEPAPPSLQDRVTVAVNGFTTTLPPTATHREALAIAERQFVPMLARLKQAVEVDLAAIEKDLNAAGAPWTPGRIPDWK